MKRTVIIVAGLVVAAALGGWWWQARAGNPPQDASRLYGNIDIRQVSVAFKQAERIASLEVDEGARVQRGQVLGRLDTTLDLLHLAQAEAELAAREEALRRLRNGSTREDRDQARAATDQASADLLLAGQQLARLEAASAETGGLGVSRADLDSARARQQVAAARVRQAQATAAAVIRGPRREDIAQAAAQVAGAVAQRDLLRQRLSDAVLQAPVDGVVRARLLEPGEMASPQRPVFTLAVTQPKWVRAYAPGPLLARLAPGQQVAVQADGVAEAITGRVGYISSVAEFTPKTVQTEELRPSLVYEVRVVVDDPSDRLRLGMPVTVQVP